MTATITKNLSVFLIGIIFISINSCNKESEVNLIEIIEEEPTIACNSVEIFANESTNAVCFEIVNNVRKVYTNNFPAHEYGPWAGPNTIQAQDFEYSMCLYPELTTTITELKEDPNSQSCGAGIIFGISNQGINYSPFARLYWVNPNTLEENLDWHIEADFTLSMDLNGGHVNSVSRYHYHNIPTDYFTNDLDIDGSEHSPILGYAADGFPIYYKYLYAETTGDNNIVASFESGFSLKSGNRPGDGVSAPNGTYDGTYVEDYEYTGSNLDECGGRFGVTPDYPNGTYYYVLTDNWPYIPRCFKGKYVDNSFQVSPGCPESTAVQDCSPVEIVANTNIFDDLKEKLNSEMYNKFYQLDFGSQYTNSEITQIKIFEADGSLAYISGSSIDFNKIASLNSNIYYFQINFINGYITKKITI